MKKVLFMIALMMTPSSVAHAQWQWVGALAGVADKVIEEIGAKKNEKQNRKQLQDTVKGAIKASFEDALKDVNIDATQLLAWSPVVATVQACREQANKWDHTRALTALNGLPPLIWKEATVERAEAMKAALSKVKQDLASKKDAKLNWKEGGADLLAALDQMIQAAERIREGAAVHAAIAAGPVGITSLRENIHSALPAADQAQIMGLQDAAEADDFARDKLRSGIEGIQDQSIVVLSYWDGFLTSLFDNLQQAKGNMEKSVGAKVEGFPLKYANTKSYGDILREVGEALQK